MTTTDDGVALYPFGPAWRLEPHPRYAELRRGHALARIRMPYGGQAWLATRYADVRKVLADPRFSRAAAAGRDVPRARPPVDSPLMLLSMDPPDHSRLRTLVAKAFTARRIEELRPRTQQVVDDLLDRMIAAGPRVDLAAGLAWPLPITIMCELLGVPMADRDDFRTWTEMTLALGSDIAPDAIVDARVRLNEYLAGLVARRRAEPTDDLLGALVLARDNEDRLSEQELVTLGVTLLISGHETTANQIGNFVFTLLAEPNRWSELVAEPAAVPRAVEELLRFVPLAASADFARIALEDVEVGGQRVRAGEAVLVQLHAANRDELAFARPDELDLHRSENSHLAFGHGIHHCLGAPLARMELQVTLGTLVRRLPGLRLAVPADDIEWRTDRLVRGVQALPVTW